MENEIDRPPEGVADQPEDDHRDGCGCLVSQVAETSEHGPMCVLTYMIATVPDELPIDENPDRPRVRIDHLGATGDPAGALAQGEVLDLTQFGRDGLYQRWGNYFVPITLATYRELVRSCGAGDCGQCRTCRTEAEHYENRTIDLDALDDSVVKAEVAVKNALDMFVAEQEQSVGDDYDLNSVEASDGITMLNQAALLLRNARRISTVAVDRCNRLNATSRPPKITPRTGDGGGRV